MYTFQAWLHRRAHLRRYCVHICVRIDKQNGFTNFVLDASDRDVLFSDQVCCSLKALVIAIIM
jgi:hypothetical protein